MEAISVGDPQIAAGIVCGRIQPTLQKEVHDEVPPRQNLVVGVDTSSAKPRAEAERFVKAPSLVEIARRQNRLRTLSAPVRHLLPCPSFQSRRSCPQGSVLIA